MANRNDTGGVPKVCLVVAMLAEARPVVGALQLEPYPLPGSVPYQVFRNEKVVLIVSGVGKLAAASAVGYLAGVLNIPQATAWLNIGIAGHRDLKVGVPALAHKVVDQAMGVSFYPALVTSLTEGSRTFDVRTVDQVERLFETDALYEMEASGFMAAASRLASAELVQVLKIVSDNKEAAPDLLNRERIEEILSGQVKLVFEVVEGLAQRVQELRRHDLPGEAVALYVEGFHFTVTQRRQLEELLRRWRAFDPSSTLILGKLGAMKGSKQVLFELNKLLVELEQGGEW